ncbi:UNVERIFIED_CONTAM: hypothetical protein FKN15_045118 [Acipenser sinensis]
MTGPVSSHPACPPFPFLISVSSFPAGRDRSLCMKYDETQTLSRDLPVQTESNQIRVTPCPASRGLLNEGKRLIHTQPVWRGWGKRPAGIGSILNRIGGKKQKMSTLEKSKLDWDSFKNEEGIGEELATHNRGKEGYVERKAFLERVDHRRFELEKSLRLSNMKR